MDYFPRQEFQRLGFSEVAIRVLEKVANLAETIDRVGSAEAALGLKQPLDALLTSLSALENPGADKMLFWDHSAGQLGWLEPAENLAIEGTDLEASGSTGLIGYTKAYGSGTLTKNWTSFQNVEFDQEHVDELGAHDNVTNPERFTIVEPGLYDAGVCLPVVSGTLNSGLYVRFAVELLDSADVIKSSDLGLPSSVITQISGTPTIAISGWSAPIECAAGDYFRCRFNNEAGDTSVGIAATRWFCVRRWR